MVKPSRKLVAHKKEIISARHRHKKILIDLRRFSNATFSTAIL